MGGTICCRSPTRSPYLIGGAGGGVLAGLWFQKVPAKWLHLALGALILLGGVRLLVC